MTLHVFPDTPEGRQAFDRLVEQTREALGIATHYYPDDPDEAMRHALTVAIPGITAAVLQGLIQQLPDATERQVLWLDGQATEHDLYIVEDLTGANTTPESL